MIFWVAAGCSGRTWIGRYTFGHPNKLNLDNFAFVLVSVGVALTTCFIVVQTEQF